MKTTTDTPVTITATSRPELEQSLEDAVSAAKKRALASGRREGIVITRHDYNVFTVALDSAVPFGLTVERELWRNGPPETTR